jgi:hypothetical protein
MTFLSSSPTLRAPCLGCGRPHDSCPTIVKNPLLECRPNRDTEHVGADSSRFDHYAKAELVGKIGDIDLLLPEHLHQIGLRHVDGPLHILGRIEAHVGDARATLYWLMLPRAPTPTRLPLSLPKSASDRIPPPTVLQRRRLAETLNAKS